MYYQMMRIYYGAQTKYTDVTYLVLTKCVVGANQVTIPANDHKRCELFGDPLYNVLKHIKVVNGDKIDIYDDTVTINLEIQTILKNPLPKFKAWSFNFDTPKDRLNFIHNNVLFTGGHLRDEYPEQLLITKYIRPDAKVLELGANFGRSTLAISAMIEDETNLVSLECDPRNAEVARINRDINNYKFHLVKSALSTRRLFQKDWLTYTEDKKPYDAVEISTITWFDLQTMYNIKFDTLVADCEGALYYILKDEPSLLNNINLVIVENDYRSISQKQEVDEIYRNAGLTVVESKEGGWGPTTPCSSCFYEVWMRK